MALFPQKNTQLNDMRTALMEDRSYFGRIEEKVKEKEKLLKRKLTLEEQGEIKFFAMQELWIDTAREVAKEEAQE